MALVRIAEIAFCHQARRNSSQRATILCLPWLDKSDSALSAAEPPI